MGGLNSQNLTSDGTSSRRINLLDKSDDNDCTPSNVFKDFKDISAKTKLENPITSGSKVVDSLVLNNIPKAGKYIRTYNTGFQIGATVARAKEAYDKDCK